MFKVRHTEETTNRTFRFPKSLLDKMSAIAQKENVSLNSFVVQCCEYAIDNLQESEKETDK
ncbi:MAG: YlcI/YnfO family protein [Monoglobales bacterium]|jgi:predicted HicB family RNase H-like nuclease